MMCVSHISAFFVFFGLSLVYGNYFSKLETNIILCGSLVIYAFIMSSLTGNFSQIDEMWSIVPMFYVFHFNQWTARGLLMFLLVVLWGLRLSYNFSRKGGYSGGEDYRWEVLRKKIPNPFHWVLFNFFFISLYQSILLLLISSPCYFETGSPIDWKDYCASIGMFGFLCMETIADQQQWEFQEEKRKNGRKRGFIQNGLFRYSRHPNFFAEIMIWWCFYAFTGSFNYSIIGPLLLTLLFQGSTKFTESISSEKYLDYKEYQKNTSRIIPWWPNS